MAIPRHIYLFARSATSARCCVDRSADTAKRREHEPRGPATVLQPLRPNGVEQWACRRSIYASWEVFKASAQR